MIGRMALCRAIPAGTAIRPAIRPVAATVVTTIVDHLPRRHADRLEHAEVVHAFPGHEHDGVQHAKGRDDH